MNIQPYRSSFTVFVADSDEVRGSDISSHLENSDYKVHRFGDRNKMMDAVNVTPPHILIFYERDGSLILNGDTQEMIEALLEKLPELHIILLTEESRFDEATRYYAEGVYDVLVYPLRSPRHLLRAIDRAAEADYFLYLNEQLKEKLSSRPGQFNDSSFALFQIWFQELFRKNDPNAGIEHFMKEVSRHLGGAEAIYFRFISGRGTLVAESSIGLEMRLLQNVGIDLKSTENEFTEALLLKPHMLAGLSELVKKGFQREGFLAFPVLSGKVVKGVVVVMQKNEAPLAARDPYIRLCLESLLQFERMHAIKQKMQKTTMLDEETEVFAREFILKKIREEISRARRISKPVSLILLAVDRFQEFQLSYSTQEVGKLVKALASLFVRNSRLNDLVGRIELDQFVIILPHTDKKGAAVKAERLRRMIENADFSKVLSKPFAVTVSVGVSEYPSICSDADGLMQTAEEALYEVKRDGHNRVCLASPTGRFVPDFVVKNEAN